MPARPRPIFETDIPRTAGCLFLGLRGCVLARAFYTVPRAAHQFDLRGSGDSMCMFAVVARFFELRRCPGLSRLAPYSDKGAVCESLATGGTD